MAAEPQRPPIERKQMKLAMAAGAKWQRDRCGPPGWLLTAFGGRPAKAAALRNARECLHPIGLNCEVPLHSPSTLLRIAALRTRSYI